MLIDLDDTILRADTPADDGWARVCRKHAGESGLFEADSLLAPILRTRDWFWSDPERHRRGRASLVQASIEIVRMVLSELGIDKPDLSEAIGTDYRALRDRSFSLIPGALETADGFRAMGIRTALVTNGSADAQRRKITSFGLESRFDLIWVEGERGLGKPEPAVYAAVLEALAVSPKSAWSVGDNLEWDALAPQRAGMTGVWIDVERRGLPPDVRERPHAIIGSLAELPWLVVGTS